MKLLKEQCATCIFRPGNPMSLRPGRVQAMVRACQINDTYIPCHERMNNDLDMDEDGDLVMTTSTTESPVCRGFYDKYPGIGQMIRISERLGLLEEVE